MAKKKTNSRKALAVALGIMGIAGLSVASASQLTVDSGNEAAIGTDIFASCDTAVAVDYAYSTTTYNLTTLTVTGIESACAGETITYSLKNATGGALVSGTGTVATGGGSHVFTLPGTPLVPVSTDLGEVTIVIG